MVSSAGGKMSSLQQAYLSRNSTWTIISSLKELSENKSPGDDIVLYVASSMCYHSSCSERTRTSQNSQVPETLYSVPF